MKPQRPASTPYGSRSHTQTEQGNLLTRSPWNPVRLKRTPLTGVFATRSPDRPNPIGLHRVTVIDVTPPTSIHVDALEAIDRTPILDLKVAMKQAADA